MARNRPSASLPAAPVQSMRGAVPPRFALAAALAAALLSIASAQAQQPPNSPSFGFSPGTGPAGLNGQIESIERMPGGQFSAVKLNNREGLYFLSSNGRWVLRGNIYDLWQGRELDNLADLRSAAQTVSLSGLGVVWNDLRPTVMGEGERETVVFIDPHCPYCQQLMSQINALVEADPRAYKFVILAVPLLGDRSARTVRNLGCASDQGAARAAMISHRYEPELAEVPNCDLGPMQKRFVLARLIGLEGVPYLIRSDGRPQAGLPPNLALWLSQAGPTPAPVNRSQAQAPANSSNPVR
ncbi:DsbC family protein [Pseudoroseomonas sp. WGS1072]|uniref:DsbC family protein n=1 Tax=Roseomonas sp. WGS1072 TaxID=3366816 RepID=UPI003BF3874D